MAACCARKSSFVDLFLELRVFAFRRSGYFAAVFPSRARYSGACFDGVGASFRPQSPPPGGAGEALLYVAVEMGSRNCGEFLRVSSGLVRDSLAACRSFRVQGGRPAYLLWAGRLLCGFLREP